MYAIPWMVAKFYTSWGMWQKKTMGFNMFQPSKGGAGFRKNPQLSTVHFSKQWLSGFSTQQWCLSLLERLENNVFLKKNEKYCCNTFKTIQWVRTVHFHGTDILKLKIHNLATKTFPWLGLDKIIRAKSNHVT